MTNSNFLEKVFFEHDFSRKCFSCYILTTEQITLSDCLYFLRYWVICILQLFFNQVVTSWQLISTMAFFEISKLKIPKDGICSAKFFFFFLHEEFNELTFTSLNTKLLTNTCKVCCYNQFVSGNHSQITEGEK